MNTVLGLDERHFTVSPNVGVHIFPSQFKLISIQYSFTVHENPRAVKLECRAPQLSS